MIKPHWRVIVPCLAMLLFPALAGAQEVGKLAVYVRASADDPIGRQMVFALRNEIGRSGTFREVRSDSDRGFAVELVTLDPYKEQAAAGTSTVYSYVILAKNPDGWDFYLTSYVGTCVQPRQCAENMFNALGEQAEELRQLVNSD